MREHSQLQRVKKIRFSHAEYAAFVASQSDQAKIGWLSISGDVLTQEEHAELNAVLTTFFRRKMPDRTGILR